MRKPIQLAILTSGAVLACVFSNFRDTQAIDPTLQKQIEQDHMLVRMMAGYLTHLQETGVLPTK